MLQCVPECCRRRVFAMALLIHSILIILAFSHTVLHKLLAKRMTPKYQFWNLLRISECTAVVRVDAPRELRKEYKTLQQTATYYSPTTDCNILKQTATDCNTSVPLSEGSAAHCNILQHTATHCRSLQPTATHCNTLQHTATHYNTSVPLSEGSATPVGDKGVPI